MILGVLAAVAGGGAGEVNLVLATQSSPFFDAYKWTSGFGTKYSNPATLPSFAVGHVDFAPNGTAISATYNGTSSFVNSLIAWAWSGSGFGTKFSDASSSPSAGYGVAFRPGTNAVVRSVSVSPFIEGFPWSGSGFGTKYANPASLPPAAGQQVAFTSSGNDVALAHNTSPRISAWSWSSGFGTRYANPATVPTSDGRGVSFHPSDNAIAVSNTALPWIQAYPWSGSGFGTKYADPATGLGETVAAYATAYSRDGNYIGISAHSSPYIHVYNWSSGFGSKFSNPASLPTGAGLDIDWTPTSDAVVIGHATSPFVSGYPFSGSGFGTKYANPSTLPNGQSNGVSFSK